MSSSAALSDDVIAAAAKRNLAPVTKIAMPGHTVKSLLHAGGAPIGSALLGGGAGFVAAPSGEGGEGAVRGAIAGGLTGLAHRAINARGAVEAAGAANALRREQAVVDHLATAVRGQPALPHGGHYVDAPTANYNVGGEVIPAAPPKGAVTPNAQAAALDREAAARTRGAGVGGWMGQGTPVTAATLAGGVAGASTPEEKRASELEELHPYVRAALGEKNASVASLLGDAAGTAAGAGARFVTPTGLSLLDRAKIRWNGGLTPEHAGALRGVDPQYLGMTHGLAPVPASMWEQLKGRVRDLVSRNRDAAGAGRLRLAQNYAAGAGGGGTSNEFLDAFGNAADASARPMPQVATGSAWTPPAPPVDPLTAARGGAADMRSLHDFMRTASDESVEADALLVKEASGVTLAKNNNLLRKATQALSTAEKGGHTGLDAARQANAGMTNAIAEGRRALTAGDSAAAQTAHQDFARHPASHEAAMKALSSVPPVQAAAAQAGVDAAAGGVADAQRAAQIAHAAHLKHQAPSATLRPGAALFSEETTLPPMREPEPIPVPGAEPAPAAPKSSKASKNPKRPGVVPTAAAAGGAPPTVPPATTSAAPAASAPAPGPRAHPAGQPAPDPNYVPPEPRRPSDAILESAGAEAQNPLTRGTAATPESYAKAQAEHAAITQTQLPQAEATLEQIYQKAKTDPANLANYAAAIDAAKRAIANLRQRHIALKGHIDEFNNAEKAYLEQAAKRKAESEAHAAAVTPSARAADPAAQAEHGGIENPWAALPIAHGQNLNETIAARQAATSAAMGQRMGERALSGALAGAGTGYLAADDEHKGQGALAGAAAGGALGAGIGHFQGERAKELVTRPLQARMHDVEDAALAANAAKELETLQKGPATNRLEGAAAGVVASGLTSRGGKREDEAKTAEEIEMHPYVKLAKDEAEKNGQGAEKVANLLGRLLGGAAVGGGLGAAGGYFLGQRDPALSDDDRSSYVRRGALLGGIGGGAAGAFSHQLAQHAMTPGMPHPGMALSDKVLAGLTATGVAGLGGLATKAWNGPSNADADAAKSKALGTMAAQDEAHSMAVKALSPTQMMVFDAVVREDPSLTHADPQLLHDSFETMRKTAPRLSTDKSAVKSFLREVASYGTGPNYVTIKNLAETEKALNQTFKA